MMATIEALVAAYGARDTIPAAESPRPSAGTGDWVVTGLSVEGLGPAAESGDFFAFSRTGTSM